MASVSSTLAKKVVELGDQYTYSKSKMSGRDVKVNELFKVQKTAQFRSTDTTSAKKRPSSAAPDLNDKRVKADLEVLRHFDVDATYGPCTGLSRLERWNRAEKFGFNPPTEVFNLISQHPTDTTYTENVWFGLNV